MADTRGGGGFLKEEIAGIPGWIWLVGAGVVIVGYLYLRRHPSTSDQQQSSQQGAGKESVQVGLIPFTTTETITGPHKHPKKGKTKNTQTSNPSGPIVSG